MVPVHWGCDIVLETILGAVKRDDARAPICARVIFAVPLKEALPMFLAVANLVAAAAVPPDGRAPIAEGVIFTDFAELPS